MSKFKGKTNAKMFAGFLEGILAITQEARFNIDDTGIEVRAIDSSNVSMLVGLYNREAFKYNPTSDTWDYNATKGTIGVDVLRLRDVIKKTAVKPNTDIGFELNDDTRKLKVALEGMTFEISLLDPTTIRKEPRSFEKHFIASTTIDAGSFAEAVTSAAKMNGYITLRADEETRLLTIKGEGETDKKFSGVRRAVEYAFNSVRYDIEESAADDIRAAYFDGYRVIGCRAMDALAQARRASAPKPPRKPARKAENYDHEEEEVIPRVRDADPALQEYLAVLEAIAHCTIQYEPTLRATAGSMFNGDRMTKIIRGLRNVAGNDGGVEIEIGHDYMGRFSAGNDMASVSYLIAPRIADEARI